MSIFNFTDYRHFLRFYLSQLPRKGRGEIKKMAEIAGVHPSLVSQVLTDKKNLNLEQTQLLAAHMDLTALETDYFINLVMYERAGTHKLKTYFKEKIGELKRTSQELAQRIRQDHQLSEEERAVYYSHWLYSAVWLFTSIDPGQSVDNVAFRFKIGRERAIEVLNFLVSTQLCESNQGLYKMNVQSIHVGRGSPHLYKHHTNWRLLSIDASDKIENDELMYTAPMSLSKSDFQNIREQLTSMIKTISEKVQQSKAEDLVYLGVDFFRMKK